MERELKGKPTWLELHHDVVAHARHAGKGRPRKKASPTTYQWQIIATVTVNQQRVDEEALRKACFIVGTNEYEKSIFHPAETAEFGVEHKISGYIRIFGMGVSFEVFLPRRELEQPVEKVKLA